MKNIFTVLCFLTFSSISFAQEKPDVMIAIPPSQMEVKSVGYGSEPGEGVGLAVRSKQTLANANALILYKPIEGEEKIAEFVEKSLKVHLNLLDSISKEIEVANQTVGDAKKTDDGKYIIRDVEIEFKDNKVFKTKKLFARTIVRNDGTSLAINIQAQYKIELEILTKWSKKILVNN